MRFFSVILVVLAIATFPLWFGLGIGFFGLLVGMLGVTFGLLAGLVGGIVGVIGWVLKGIFSLLPGVAPWNFSCHSGPSWFTWNGWTVAALVLIVWLLARRR